MTAHSLSSSAASIRNSSDAHSGRSQVGFLGDREMRRRCNDSPRFDMRPMALASSLPRAGIKIERQQYASIGLPIVFSEISGGKQVSIFIPEKRADGEVLTKKGAPTFYSPNSGMKGLTEVLYVDLTKENQSPEKVFVKVDGYARKAIKDIGENHNPEKRMNYSFANSVRYLASDIPGAVGSIQSVANFSFCSDPGITGFRTASAGGVLTGAVNYLRAGREMEVADRINDVAGKQFALLRYVRSAFEITSGFFAAGVQGLTLIPQAAKAAAAALPILGSIWNCLGMGSALFSFIPMILNARQASKWMQDLDQKMEGCSKNTTKAAAGLQFLINKLELSKEEKEKVFQEALNKPLHSLIHEEVMLNEDEEKILHRKDRQEIAQIIDQVISESNLDDPLISDIEQVRLNLSVRLMKGWAHYKMVREAEYRRTFGGASVELLKKEIREETDLSRELHYNSSALDQIENLLKTIKEDVNSNWKLTVFITSTCIIGILGTIASMVFTAGTAPFIVGIAASVVSNIMGTLIDLYCFKEEMNGLEESSYKERIMIILFSLLTVMSAVLGGVFYQDAVTLGIVIVGSICMLGLNAYAYRLSLDKEKEAKVIAVKKAEEKRLRDQEEERLRDKRERIRHQQILNVNCRIHPVF